MKGSFVSTLIRRCAAFLLLNAPVIVITHQPAAEKSINTIAVSFDSLFPNSPYKKALDTSMRLVGDMQELQLRNKEEKQLVSVDVTDFLVGKLFRLKLAVDSFKESRFTLLSQDLEYLKGLVRFIDSGRRNLRFDANDESVQLIADLVADIQGVLDFTE